MRLEVRINRSIFVEADAHKNYKIPFSSQKRPVVGKIEIHIKFEKSMTFGPFLLPHHGG